MNQEEYEAFWKALVNSEVVELHEFEKREIFEGCMPIEVMAKRGIDMSFKAISNLIGIHSKLRVFGLFSPFNNPSFKPYNLGA